MQQMVVAHALDTDPEQVLALRDIPLMSRATWELLLTMKDAGWTWRLWRKPTQRQVDRGVVPPLPEGYKEGDPKVWFTSGVTVSPDYLRPLLCTGALMADGLDMVRHGLDPEAYELMLKGDLSRAGAPRAVRCKAAILEADIDDMSESTGSEDGMVDGMLEKALEEIIDEEDLLAQVELVPPAAPAAEPEPVPPAAPAAEPEPVAPGAAAVIVAAPAAAEAEEPPLMTRMQVQSSAEERMVSSG